MKPRAQFAARLLGVRQAISLLVASLCLLGVVHAVPAPDAIAGKYVADDKDHGIELVLRGEVLHGRIAWTRDPRLTDERNRDPALRGRKLAGIEHIRGFIRDSDGRWSGGTLYNPEDGKTYQAQLWLDDDERLIIQGQPNVRVLGGLLGALFGRATYTRERAR